MDSDTDDAELTDELLVDADAVDADDDVLLDDTELLGVLDDEDDTDAVEELEEPEDALTEEELENDTSAAGPLIMTSSPTLPSKM